MKRVYLDQNKWIELLRAHVSGELDPALASLLDLMDYGVVHGLVSLPLSAAHYHEVGHRRDPESRVELAAFMAAYSRFHSLAPRQALLPWEIEYALSGVFGSAPPIGSPQPFGIGVGHAFGAHLPATTQGGRDAAAFLARHPPESDVRLHLETHFLAGPSPCEVEDMGTYNPFLAQQFGQEWAKGREVQRQAWAAEGWHRGDLSRRLAMVDAWQADGPLINATMRRVGLDPMRLDTLGREGLTALIEAIPLTNVTTELVRLREAADSRPWTGNDLLDLSFLGPAIVYCDVVVTERQWASFAERAGFEARYGTRVISSLRELAPRLV